MRKRGFSFLEVLVALAILTVLSVSLLPLMTGLAASDQRLRTRARAWEAARSHLTALTLGDPKAEAESDAFAFRWNREAPPGTGAAGAWNSLAIVPKEGTNSALTLYLRTGGAAR